MDGGAAGHRRVLSKDLAQRRRGKPSEALPNESTGGVVNFNRITPDEVAPYRRYPGCEKRLTPSDDGCNRPVIDRQNADGGQAERDPQLSCAESGGSWCHPGSDVFSGDGTSHGFRVICRRYNGRDARVGGHSGCCNLRGNTARTVDTGAAPPPQLIEDLIGVPDRAEQLRLGDQPGIMGIEAGRVGEYDQQSRTDKVGDDGSQSVVVAESEFVDDDGVVLVDDGNNTQFEQAVEGGTRVEVRLAACQNVASQEHLADHKVVGRE